ncbi:hypothetical protein Clacol_001863 [Clathrus columnatus]|uniref:Uncharacterized protein n=1 Tax=Clathrus columnatus TaxID=1419009 RepID=A0AAV5A368_9AGAM|nr:hypothetical protein Clacol_001863 [Clathrus columnatus]
MIIQVGSLYIVTLGMPTAGLWYFFRVAATGPDIIWSRENSSPWNTISQDETPKLWMPLGPRQDSTGTLQHQYNRRWTRPKSIQKERAGEAVTYKSFIDRPYEKENRGGIDHGN